MPSGLEGFYFDFYPKKRDGYEQYDYNTRLSCAGFNLTILPFGYYQNIRIRTYDQRTHWQHRY